MKGVPWDLASGFVAPAAVCAILPTMAERSPQDKPSGPAVFDRALLARRRARALARLGEHDFLHKLVADEFSERLSAIQRDFQTAVEIGARTGHFAKTLAAKQLGALYGLDLVAPRAGTGHKGFVIADEERLPLGEETLDLVLAPLCLHVVNDLPGALTQIRRALKPDGLFLGTLFGGETLSELRRTLMEAELETTGGASPRIAPVVDIRDAGGLLQRAGFALPVSDSDVLTIRYDSAIELMGDLAGMGETNVLRDRRRTFMRRETLTCAAELYQDRHADPDGRIRASFEMVYLAGWSPDDSQQKPLRPGSAVSRLADALGTKELPAGEKPG